MVHVSRNRNKGMSASLELGTVLRTQYICFRIKKEPSVGAAKITYISLRAYALCLFVLINRTEKIRKVQGVLSTL